MGNALRDKTIHELRVIAQSFGVSDIFEKEPKELAQAIELKQREIIPPKVNVPYPPKYDARLMAEAPSEQASPEEIVEILTPYIKLGLRVELDEERWHMSCGNKTDEGTMRMPLVGILRCARKLMT